MAAAASAAPSVSEYLELEHVIGYHPETNCSLVCHPCARGVAAYAAGGLVVVASADDVHAQTLLRGHNERVTALAIDGAGGLLASGQASDHTRKDREAPVYVWDLARRRQLYRLHGHLADVRALAFSHDARFLASADADGQVYIWAMPTGELVVGTRLAGAAATLAWTGRTEAAAGARYPRYTFLSAAGAHLCAHSLDYDVKALRYGVTTEEFKYARGASGRVFTGLAIDGSDSFVVAGTVTGDFATFNLRGRAFRENALVCTNGVQSIALHGEFVFVGGGDGAVKRLRRNAAGQWTVEAEARLDGAVRALSVGCEGVELMAGTAKGTAYRMLAADLKPTIAWESITSPVAAASFGARPDVVCTIAGPTVALFDLNDYAVLSASSLAGGKAGAAASVHFVDDETLLTGWSSGALIAFEPKTAKLRWDVPNAHRGTVRSVRATPMYIATGGDDASVRVWARATHQFITQFQEFRKPVSAVLPDVKSGNLLHAASLDKTIATFDLKTERRVYLHNLPGDGAVTALSQRLDSELELVTASTTGVLHFWDCDIAAPVMAFSVPGAPPSQPRFTSVAVSPRGTLLAAGGGDGALYVWDIREKLLLARGVAHTAAVNSVTWTPDEKQLLSCGEDATLGVWNVYQ